MELASAAAGASASLLVDAACGSGADGGAGCCAQSDAAHKKYNETPAGHILLCYTSSTMRTAFLLLVCSAFGFSQAPNQGKGKANAFASIDWNAPFPAHKIVGNVYFVGSEQLGSFLITTPAGHILINSDYEETIPVIRAGVESSASSLATSKFCSAVTPIPITCRAMRCSRNSPGPRSW